MCRPCDAGAGRGVKKPLEETCENCSWGDLDLQSHPDSVYMCENSSAEQYLQLMEKSDSCEHYSPKIKDGERPYWPTPPLEEG